MSDSTFSQGLVFASANRGKIDEVMRVGHECGVRILSPLDLQQKYGEPPEVEESGVTYLENARLKASAFSQWCQLPAIGDDSGLEVDVLDGAPGLYTARYAGAHATSKTNMEKLLDVLNGRKEREARYRSVLSCVFEERELFTAEGLLRGRITLEAFGSGGFGYDPIFEVEQSGKTLAELKETTMVETHRVRSLKSLFDKLRKAGHIS